MFLGRTQTPLVVEVRQHPFREQALLQVMMNPLSRPKLMIVLCSLLSRVVFTMLLPLPTCRQTFPTWSLLPVVLSVCRVPTSGSRCAECSAVKLTLVKGLSDGVLASILEKLTPRTDLVRMVIAPLTELVTFSRTNT